MVRWPLAVLVVLAFVLSGCSSGGGESDDGSSSSSTMSTTSGSSTSKAPGATSSSSASSSKTNTTTSSNSASNTTSGGTSSNQTGNQTSNQTAAPSGPVQVVDGTYVVAAEGCGSWAAYANSGMDLLALASGQLHEVVRVQFDANPLTIGRTYTATFEFDQGYLAVEVAFFDDDDGYLSANAIQSPNFGGVTMTGTVPAETAKVVLFACAGPTMAKVHYEA